jgi:hypothetical protein
MVVDIRPLKGLATKVLASDSTLRKILLSEPDEMEPRDYLAKLGTWLAILREEDK